MDRIMKEVDSDNNGFIDYTEFLKATVDVKKILNSDNLKIAFNMFDSDSSGSISAQELKKVLASGLASEEDVWHNIIKEVDQNGDGEIDFSEFESIIMNNLN